MAELMNGAQIVLECLVREKVDCFFGYPGGVTLPLYDALYDHQIKHILVRHEQNACFAAQGYARATGKVGVCCATSGPGATNLITALVDALMDSIPVVAITGQVSTKMIGSDAVPRSGHIRHYAALHEAQLHGEKSGGPAADHSRGVPYCSVGTSPVRFSSIFLRTCSRRRGHYTPVTTIHLPGYKISMDGHAGQIRRAAQMIWEAEKPMVYAGGGILAAGASENLRELVELADIPAVTTLMALGALPANHPNYISMPGMHGSYAANMAITDSDLLIALGTRFDDRVTGRLAAFAPHARVIHVDIDPAEISKNRTADIPIVGDVKKVLEKLNQNLRELAPEMQATNSAARKAWWSQVRGWKAEHPLEPEFSTDEIKPQHLMAEIDRLSGGEAIVASDVGQHQMWGAQLLRFNHPRLWINSGGLGSMGFGLPAAIGAQFARPDKLVFALVGDGGFQMSIPELATIANHALPVKIIVMNNGYLGMVRQWQELFYKNRLSSVLLEGFPDPEKLAGAYGFTARPSRSRANYVRRWKRLCGIRDRTY